MRDNAALTAMEGQLLPSDPEVTRTYTLGTHLNSVLDKPVAPRKSRIFALGLLGGLVDVGCTGARPKQWFDLQQRGTKKHAAMSSNRTPAFNEWKRLDRCSRPACRRPLAKSLQKCRTLIPISKIPNDNFKPSAQNSDVLSNSRAGGQH